MESVEDIKILREYVTNLKDGKVDDEHEETLITLLSRTWDLFSDSSETSMNAEKLGRIDNVIFKYPDVITFEIERHGATVHGSVYAHVHKWTLNLTEMKAICDPYYKKRLVGKRDAPLKTQPLAQKVADAVINYDRDNKDLVWKSYDKVKILVGNIIPETNEQTTASRRKRFRNRLDEMLKTHGWSRPKQSYIYERIMIDE